MLVELLDAASILEGLLVSQITPEVLAEVVEGAEGVEKMGVRMD